MDVVGIDVSKATLDAYALTSQQARQFANDPAGHQGLVAWLQGLGVGVAVLEASGGYEQAAARWLRRADWWCTSSTRSGYATTPGQPGSERRPTGSTPG